MLPRIKNTESTINFSTKKNGEAVTTATFEAGDIQISKDGGGFANVTNSPTHIGHGAHKLTLTATELNADVVLLAVQDQTATKVWDDTDLLIETYPANIGYINGAAATVVNMANDYNGTGYTKTNSTIGTCTTNTDMRGTDSANTIAPDNAGVAAIKAKTDLLNFTGSDVQSIASNMRGTDSANTTAPDNAGIAAIKTQTDKLNFTGDDVQSVASNMVGTDGANTIAPDNAGVAAIKAKTDLLNFTGDDVQAIASNMRGTDSANTVAPDNAGIAGIKAKTDLLNFTGDDVQSIASNMVGTNGANTIAPDNAGIAAIKTQTDKLNFTGDDVQAIASNMRGTDGANTTAPDNTSIGAIKTQTDKLNFTGDDVQSVASNMRGTDSANTTAPDNAGIAGIKAKTDLLNFTGDDVQAIASNMVGTAPTAAEVRAEMDANSTKLALVSENNGYLEADTYIDKTTDSAAWRIKWVTPGGDPAVPADVLMTKLIKDVNGTAISATTTIVGQQVNV